MDDSNPRILFVIISLMLLVLMGLIVNVFAVDRLEQQVIRVAQTLEEMDGIGMATVQTAKSTTMETSEPGTSTGIVAKGWGGKPAEILHVEGAVDNAPLSIAQKPKPQNDKYVNRRTSPPGSLNYYTTNEGDTTTVSKAILGTMLSIDPDSPPKVIPNLATSWEVSDDRLTYTYHLRRGVQFADGRPFSAKDVAFSFNVMRDPQVQADHLRSSFDDVVSLETPDEYTVVVKYRQKYWKGLYTIGHSLRILNKGWYEEQIPNYAEKLDIKTYATDPGKPGFADVFNKIRVPCPGTGPYYFPTSEFDATVPVEVVQNPFYFGIQVHPEWHNFEALRWIYISDPVAAFEAFRKQKFDVTTVDFQEWDDEYSKDPTITDISEYYEYDHMGLGFSVVYWNTRKAPFDDPRVRKAMAHLTNRQWILDEIERGRGSIASCVSKKSYPNYPEMEPLAFDIEKAKQLLAEAGWTDSDGDGILDKDGQRFEFELKAGSARRFYIQVAAALEDACKQVGIRMTLRTLEWATFIEDFYLRRFDAACLYSSFSDPWIDPYEELHSSQDVPRAGNATGWHNDRADELLENMRVEFDDANRNNMFHELCHLYQEEQPSTLLVHGIVGVLQNKRFENVTVRPVGLRVYDAWVEPENVLYK